MSTEIHTPTPDNSNNHSARPKARNATGCSSRTTAATTRCLDHQNRSHDATFAYGTQDDVVSNLNDGASHFGGLWAPNTYEFLENSPNSEVLCHGGTVYVPTKNKNKTKRNETVFFFGTFSVCCCLAMVSIGTLNGSEQNHTLIV